MEVDKILAKLKKDLKFHRKGMLNAKSITSEHNYNDILEINFEEAKSAITNLINKEVVKARIDELNKALNHSFRQYFTQPPSYEMMQKGLDDFVKNRLIELKANTESNKEGVEVNE